MQNPVIRLLFDETATTAIEYGLIAAGIAVAIIATVNMLGATVLTNEFLLVGNALNP